MTEDEYKNLTEITVKDKDGKNETVYVRIGDSDTFKKPVNITGVTAQDGVYNGLPQQGYTGTITNEQGYDGEYEITYYNYAGEKTTPENSGAEGEGKAPVYAGNYKVKIATPESNKSYYGLCELEFKIERATTEIVEQPKLSGYYGTAVKDMKLTPGVVEVGGIEVEGEWHVADPRGSDIPEVGTENSYELMFLVKDFRNYKDVATMVVPEIEKATP